MFQNGDRFELEGYKYDYELDIEPRENCKIFHEVTAPNGERIKFSFTPYAHLTYDDFKRVIDLHRHDVEIGRVQKGHGFFNHNSESLFELWMDLVTKKNNRCKA